MSQFPTKCVQRYPGGSKEGGCQYPQAIAVTDPKNEGLYVIFSLNKEDIWLAKLPFANIP